MKGGIGQLMKQVQEMQANMEKAEEERASAVVNGESGGGMVKVSMNCKYHVQSIAIDDTIIGDDKDMLEDLILAALNDAQRKVDDTVQDQFAGMASGMNLPPGFKLPF